MSIIENTTCRDAPAPQDLHAKSFQYSSAWIVLFVSMHEAQRFHIGDDGLPWWLRW